MPGSSLFTVMTNIFVAEFSKKYFVQKEIHLLFYTSKFSSFSIIFVNDLKNIFKKLS